MSDWDTVHHQDFAGKSGAPLGVFDSGKLLELVPNSDSYGDIARARWAERLGRPVEILLTCPNHPASSAVDCLICAPDD